MWEEESPFVALGSSLEAFDEEQTDAQRFLDPESEFDKDYEDFASYSLDTEEACADEEEFADIKAEFTEVEDLDEEAAAATWENENAANWEAQDSGVEEVENEDFEEFEREDEGFEVPWQGEEEDEAAWTQGDDSNPLPAHEFDDLETEAGCAATEGESRLGLDAVAGMLDTEFDVPYAEEVDLAVSPMQEDFFSKVGNALRRGAWRLAALTQIRSGERDENKLTNQVFFARHPELGGRKIRPHEKRLVAEWRKIRDELIRPMIEEAISVPTLDHTPATATDDRASSLQIRDTWNDPPPKTYELPIEFGADKSLTIFARLALYREQFPISRPEKNLHTLLAKRPNFSARASYERWLKSPWRVMAKQLQRDRWRIFFTEEEWAWLDTRGHLNSYPFLRRHSKTKYLEALEAEFRLKELDYFQPHHARLKYGVSDSHLTLDHEGRFTLTFTSRPSVIRLIGKAFLTNIGDELRDQVLAALLGRGSTLAEALPLLGLASMLVEIGRTEQNQRILNRSRTADGAREVREIQLRLVATLLAKSLVETDPRFRGWSVQGTRLELLRMDSEYMQRLQRALNYRELEKQLKRKERGLPMYSGPTIGPAPTRR